MDKREISSLQKGLLVAAVSGLVAILWFNRLEPNVPAMPQASVMAKPAAAKAGTESESSAALASLPPNSVIGSGGAATSHDLLVNQFLKATNLATFVEYAKQRPEQGGILLARRAVALCTGAERDWAGEKAVNPLGNRHARAISALQARCEALTQQDRGVVPADYMNELDRFGAERDPWRTAEKKLDQFFGRKDRTIDVSMEQLNWLKSSPSTLRFDQLAQPVGTGAAFFFEGQSYAGDREWVLANAWIAYKIDNGLAAAKDDEFGGNEALVFCVQSGGACEGDGLARATKNLTREEAEKVKEIYPKLRKALDNADINAFVRPAKNTASAQ